MQDDRVPTVWQQVTVRVYRTTDRLMVAVPLPGARPEAILVEVDGAGRLSLHAAAGARHGACFMAGGDPAAYDVVAPILRDLAVDEQGTIFVGPPGAGHFVKLVHNAIEFGMVQAIAEGVELLQRSDYPLELPPLFTNWLHGSVIRSWLVELMGRALQEQADLGSLSTYVEDTGEVKWVLD